MASAAVANSKTSTISNTQSAPQCTKALTVYAGLTLYAVVAGCRPYWMVVTTFKPDRDLYHPREPSVVVQPERHHVRSPGAARNTTGFVNWIRNIVVVSVAG